MEAQTIAAFVVSGVYFIAATVASWQNPDPQSGIAIFLGLILLLVLPYLVHCLVVGGCTWYAWGVPIISGLMLLLGLVDLGVGRKAGVDERENKNV